MIFPIAAYVYKWWRVQEFCDELKHGLSARQLEDLMIRNNSWTGQLEVDCFLDHMDLYLQVTMETRHTRLQMCTIFYL